MPGKYNRVSMAARGQLAGDCSPSSTLDDSVGFVMLAGAGGAFTAGGDIAGFLAAFAVGGLPARAHVAAPERCSKVVVAAPRGFARRGASSSRSRATSGSLPSDVQLALPEATIGMIPGCGWEPAPGAV